MRPVALRQQPRVSVVVPHYNYGQFLPTAVASALDQTDIDLEVIIVDDRSTDGSVEIARQLAASDHRVQLIEHEQNMRHIRTYNDGLSRATGEYVVLLSADDAVSPNSISRAVGLMEANPDVGLVYGRVECFDGDLPRFRPTRHWWQMWDGAEWIERVARRGRNAITNPEAVMRKSVYEDIGGYNPAFPHAGDMLIWLQAAARSDVGFVGGPRQGYYRGLHGNNMHDIDFGGVLDDISQVRDVFQQIFAEVGPNLPDADGIEPVWRSALAREAILKGTLLVANGEPRDTLEKFRAFAEETWPRSSDSLAWRWSALADITNASVEHALRTTENQRWTARYRRANFLGL
ncbi:glycosyltransferase family 2 protein [Gordonia sp. DT218]|uniref:glycosyltransferase family 2 protein n=1 Tax=unclassified Gordonia (in: high G+C Gram-positive bacteria) TaxID=2657482 RepID=UPI003CF191F5